MAKQKNKAQLSLELEQAQKRIAELEQAAKPKAGTSSGSTGQDGQENEAFYRSFIEQTNNGVVILDEQGNVSVWNSAQERITGTPREEAIGRKYWDVQFRSLTPESRASVPQDIINKNQQILLETQNIAMLQSWTIDYQAGVLNIGPGYDHILEWPAGIYKLEDLKDLLHPQDKEYVEKVFAQADQNQLIDIECRILTNGELKWVHIRTNTIVHEDGKHVLVPGFTQDVTKRRQAEELTYAQRNLARLASTTTNREDALPICLNTALQVSGMDCGGIYLFDSYRQSLDLAYHQGLGQTFIQEVSHYEADAPNVQTVLAGMMLYFTEADLRKQKIHEEEGLRSLAVIPILDHGYTLGCINIGSHTLDQVPELARQAIETIATEIGSVIAHLQTEALLRESEENYRSLINSQESIIATIDAEGVLHYINRIGAALLAVSPDDIVGRKLHDLLPPQTADWILSHVHRVISSGQGLVTETQNTVEGRPNWQRVSIQPIHNADETITLSMVNSLDITERKQTEEDLKETRERLLEAQEMAHIGHWEWDLKRKILIWSDEVYRIFGVSPAEFTPTVDKFENAIHPDDKEDFLRKREKMLAEKHYASIDHRIILPDGQVRHVQENTQLVLDSSGNVTRVIGTVQDITERTEADEARRESDNLYRLLFETMVQGVVFQDHEGRIIHANPAAQDILGLTLEQMVGRASIDLRWGTIREDGSIYPSEDHPAMIALRSGQPVHNKVIGVFNPTRDAYCWLNVNAVPRFKNGDNKPYQVYTTFEDITERKQAENALAASEKKLQSLISSQTHFVIRTDMQGNYIYWNSQFENEFGWIHPDGMQSANTLKTICEHHHQRVIGVVQECISQPGKVFSVEIDKPARDGGIRTTLWEFMCITDEHDQPSEIQCMGVEITDRKIAEESLRESESKYRLLAENVSDVIWILDLESSKFRYVSPSIMHLRGYSVDEVLAQNMTTSLTPAFANQLAQVMPARVKEFQQGILTTYTDEIEQPCKDGSTVWTETTTRFVENPETGKLEVYGVSRDISERRKAETTIRRIEKRNTALIERAPDGIAMLDINGVFLFVSPSAYRMFGYEAEEIIGTLSRDKVHPQDLHLLANLQEKMQRAPTAPQNLEYRFLHKNGSYHWIECTYTNMLTEPSVQAIVLNFRVITERKQAENALRESEVRFHSLFENSPIAIWEEDFSLVKQEFDRLRAAGVTDFRTYWNQHPEEFRALPNMIQIIEINQASVSMMKAKNKEEVVRDISYYFTDESLKVFENEMVDLAMGHTRFRSEIPIKNALAENAIYELTLYVQPGYEKSLGRILASFQDITERKRAEEKARQQSEQIQLLYEASQQLNRTLDLKEIYQTICDFMSVIAPNDTLFISAFDHETQLITCRAYWLENKWLDVTPFPAIPLEEEGKGTQSLVIRTGESMLINDYQALLKNTKNVYLVESDTNEFVDEDPPEEEVTRSALIVPLKSGGMVTGVIQVASYRQDAYTENQLKLLEALALHIASAEQNAMLYTQMLNELSERKQAEEALRASNETAQAILNASTESVFLMDINGKVIAANDMTAFRLGKSAADIVGMNMYELIPSTTAAYRKERVATVFHEKKPLIFEDERLGAWIENSIYPIFDNDGEVRRVAIYGRDITERKKGEEALRNREELYRLISSINADFVFSEIMDEKGDLFTKWVGGGFESITGYTLDEYNAKGGWLSILHPDDREKDAHDLAALKNNHKVVNTLRMIHKNGSVRWVQVHANPLWDSEQQLLTGIYGAVQDITERNQAEVALRTSEEKYRVLIESMDNAIVTVDREGKFLYMNDMAAVLMGDSIDHLIGKTMYDLFPETIASNQMNTIQQVIREDKGSVVEATSLVRGEYRWYRASIQPIHDEDGQVGQVLINLTDIHDLKTTHQQLQELNHTLEERVKQRTAEVQDLYDNAPAGYHSLDANGNILMINQTELNWLGYSREEMIGHSILNFFTSDSIALFKENFPAFKKRGWLRDLELEFIRKNGNIIPILVNATAVYDEQGNYILSRSTVLDNTEHKAADEALRNANFELARAMRMKDEFLASMSHELRTPLNGILGLSEALQVDVYGPLNEKQKSTLVHIENSGRHLLELINDILDVSKIEAGKFELEMNFCSLGDICQSSIHLTKGMAAKKRQNVNFTMTPASIVVNADARRLKQVIVNLLSNAVKFTPEGGILGLDVTENEADNIVYISVWDNGIGISPEDIKKLFQPFVQLDSSLSRHQTGTGLGLTLVQRLVEMHGGSIEIQSTPGQGSRFTVAIPCMPADSATDGIEGTFQSKFHYAVIVEDESMDAGHLARYCRSLGINPIIHSTGKDALERVIATRPNIVFLDLHLPDISGWDVLTQLKSCPETKHIPIVITSVDDEKQKAYELKADGYLVKFFAVSDLRAILADLQKTPSTGEIVNTPSDKPIATVIIVDDNQINIETVVDYLGAKNFNVISAQNGLDFLARVPHLHPDIVLMDIQMPEVDGLETIRRLRSMPDQRVASVPVVALTALAMPGDRELCIEAGADEYVTKPFRLKELHELILQMLEEHKRAM